MNVNPTGDAKRRLDGPVRRVNPAPPPVPAPVAQVAPAVTAPVSNYKYEKPASRRRPNWLKRILLTLVVLLLAGGLIFVAKTLLAANKVISHNGGSGAPALNGEIDPTKLKGEGDGRINILLLGVGGSGHEGSKLSDTLMVMSLDPKTKDVAMLSIPRDLYVKIPGNGYGKINSANHLGGPELAEKVVSNILGVPIHYYVEVDFAGFKKAVDAVGGVDIDVKEALYDSEYPCDFNQYRSCGYRQPAGRIHMNGTMALKFARCRKGTCGNDYGRAARQQQVLVALQKKTMDASTLTNPLKIAGLIDTVGDHVKTDLQLNEIKKLAELAAEVDTAKIVNKVIDTSPDGLLIDGTGTIPGAGSIQVPKAGTFDYSEIQDFVKSIFIDHYITSENVAIEIQNGSGAIGLAGKVVSSLVAAQYNVLEPLTAPQQYTRTFIYDYTGGKNPYTLNYLEKRFGVKAQRGTLSNDGMAAPTGGIQPGIRVILGTDYAKVVDTTETP